MNSIGIRFWCVLGIVLSFQLPTALANQIPDGLCLVFDARGRFGHGFIVQDKLVSAAHVLDVNIYGVFVTERGRLRDITHLLSNQPRMHPEYRTSDELATKRGLAAAVPFDLAYISLNRLVQSNFELFAYDTVSNLLTENKNLGAIGKWSVAYIEMDEALMTQLLSTAIVSKFNGVVSEANSIEIIKLAIGSSDDEVVITRGDRDGANVFIDTTLSVMHGQSGMPIYDRTPNGRLIVTGLASAIAKISSFQTNRHGQQNLFTPAINL